MLAFLHVRPSPLLGRGFDVDFPMLAGCLGLLGLAMKELPLGTAYAI